MCTRNLLFGTFKQEYDGTMKRKTISLALIALLSFWTLASLTLDCLSTANPYIQSLPQELATEHAYIRANGTVEPSTLPIERDGNFYKLTDNILNYTFEVQRDNIVIDGNNFTLSLPSYGEIDSNHNVKIPSAIFSIFNRTNIVLVNLNLSMYSCAVEIQNSSNILILRNNIINGNNGIYMQNSANCSVVANQIINNPLHAIFIRDCSSFNVSYNTISGSKDAGIIVDRVFQPVDDSQVSIFMRNTFSDYPADIFFRGQHTNNFIFENNFLGGGINFCGVNCTGNSVHDNYWIGHQVKILNYTSHEQDPSPLANPISTEFNYSLFNLPSFAQSPLPASTADSTTGYFLVVVTFLVIVITLISILLYRRKTQRINLV